MRQISIRGSIPFNEEYTLGEQHHLGELKAVYYITYTNADIRRYRANIIFMIIAIISSVISCIFIYFSLTHLSRTISSFSIYFYSLAIPLSLFSTLYNLAAQRKWGNRPLIGPRTRHLRVYVYQGGLVKQVGKKSEVIRWPEIAEVTSIPYVAPQPKHRSNQVQPATLNLKLHNGRLLKINGAIEHADELAELLKYMRNTYNSEAV